MRRGGLGHPRTCAGSLEKRDDLALKDGFAGCDAANGYGAVVNPANDEHFPVIFEMAAQRLGSMARKQLPRGTEIFVFADQCALLLHPDVKKSVVAGKNAESQR